MILHRQERKKVDGTELRLKKLATNFLAMTRFSRNIKMLRYRLIANILDQEKKGRMEINQIT